MRRALAVASVVALVLVACSDDVDPAARPATSPVMSTPPTPVTQPAPAVPPPGTATITASPNVTGSPTSAAPATTSPAGPPTVATLTAPIEAWCTTAQRLHELTSAFRQLDATDAAAVEVSLAGILDELAVIADVVPDELSDDLAVSTEAFGLLRTALAEVDFELDAADLTALDARADAIAAANDRIRAYNAAECGIDVGVIGEDEP